MTDLTYRALRQRLVSEFADDPGTVSDVVEARDITPIAVTLAKAYTRYMELLRSLSLSESNIARDMRHEITEAAERREVALLEIMRFFDLHEIRDRDVVVRRSGEAGLSVWYRTFAPTANNA